jgi:hypothetical protein
MRFASLLALPMLAGTVAAQFPPLPSVPLEIRVAPRAAWSSVLSAGTTATGSTFRADTMSAASNDTLFVFGGCLNNNTSTTVNDIWGFDSTTGLYTQRHDGVVSLAPHARGRGAGAWNPSTQRFVIFGGDNRATGPLPADTLLNDIWEYDPANNTWADVTPAGGSAPSPRRWAAMSYDPQTGGMLVFGGDVGGGTPSDETWLFIGGSWFQLSPANVPPARRMASLVHRPDFNDVLLCGGDDVVNFAPDAYRHLDVWTWSGADWTRISNYDWATQTGTFPTSVMANKAVYDEVRKRVVMQGGQGIAAGTANNATYIFGTTVYNGSPTNYTSEFDCLTNSWTIYASSTSGTTPYNNTDPAIGRISRYSAGFIPATGKVYKISGQDPTKSGARPTYNVYEYQATQLGAATAYGNGCTGPGGQLTLTSTGTPWTGRIWEGACSNVGAGSTALVLWGFTQSALPLDSILPGFGQPGCLLLTSLDLTLGPVPSTAGTVGVFLPIANSASLAGVQVNGQVLEIDTPATGLWTSNGLTLTIGAM